MKILVTGGAGFIGSFMVKRLLDEGHEVSVLDSLERGEAKFEGVKFYRVDLRDRESLEKALADDNSEAVLHFAAFISMEESVKDPYLYFSNNVLGSLNLIELIAKKGVMKFIFSSTAGVYGNPNSIPIPEGHDKKPTNPYGESKLMVERILSWYQKTHDLNFVALRYFNASGASLDGSMGEAHNPETHLIPKAIYSILNDEEFYMFGTDYDTPDGTAVRDYIHVVDLVEAHLLALNMLSEGYGGYFYNVGTGNGHSIREVVSALERISGQKMKVKEVDRRPGDANILVADVAAIKKDLNFSPKYSDLDTIVKSAWEWHSKR
jgi:UDP-glucose 4-epimerase